MNALRGPFAAALLALVLLGGQGAAQAAGKNADIARFFGEWDGRAVSEGAASNDFPLTARDLNVVIRPASGGDFIITWSTVQMRGDPAKPREVRKTTTRSFEPGAKPNLWLASGPRDPFDGVAMSWARIRRNTLTVYSMAIDEEGGYEMHIYDRTLVDVGMELNFRSVRNGEVVRIVQGLLIRKR